MKTLVAAMGAAAALAGLGPCSGQTPGDVLALAAQHEEMVALLEHESATVRLAAVDQGLASSDQTLRRLIREAALVSDDPTLQTKALLAVLEDSPILMIRMIAPDEPTEDQLELLERQPQSLEVQNLDKEAGTFTVHPTNNQPHDKRGDGPGQVVDGVLSLTFAMRRYGLEARIVSASELAGSVSRGVGEPIAVTIALP